MFILEEIKKKYGMLVVQFTLKRDPEPVGNLHGTMPFVLIPNFGFVL